MCHRAVGYSKKVLVQRGSMRKMLRYGIIEFWAVKGGDGAVPLKGGIF
jgi:hypothetical protein